jgi:hypothetical protein
MTLIKRFRAYRKRRARDRYIRFLRRNKIIFTYPVSK